VRKKIELSGPTLRQIGDRVRELAVDKGWSLTKLAAESGVGLGTVMEIARGEREPSLSTMLAFVSSLGLRSIEELLAPLGTVELCKLEGLPLTGLGSRDTERDTELSSFGTRTTLRIRYLSDTQTWH